MCGFLSMIVAVACSNAFPELADPSQLLGIAASILALSLLLAPPFINNGT